MHLLYYKACLIVKQKMFICKHISKLIAYALSVTDNLIDVAMRVAVYPIVNIT